MSKKLQIINSLVDFVQKGNPSINKKNIPLNKSLLEIGLLDSFGIIELISFIEKKYKIKIEDKEINKKDFGSLEKMKKLIEKKMIKKND